MASNHELSVNDSDMVLSHNPMYSDIHLKSDVVQTIGDCTYSTTGAFKSHDMVSFSLLHLNCRSLNKNINNIATFLWSLEHQPSVVALTETWLKDGDENYATFLNTNLL